MGTGLKAKKRRSASVKIDYLIHIQEIKPWPPSQSLRSLRSVMIQWENGERSSGSTSHVVPSLDSEIGEGKIEFNESFRLPITLVRDMSVRSGHADIFQKNCLEFNLFEPRRDKTVKGQLLGTAIIDLADYGIIKETLSMTASINCKRNYKNTDQPLIYIKIHPVEKSHASSSARDSLSKVPLKDISSGDSALINEENAEGAEVASFSDDDVSSHSSVTAVASVLGENGPTRNTCRNDKKWLQKSNMMPQDANHKLEQSPSCTSSLDTSSDFGSPVNGHASSNSLECSSVTTQRHVVSPFLVHDKLEEDFVSKTSSGSKHSDEEVQEKVVTHRNMVINVQTNSKNPGTVNCNNFESNGKINGRCEDDDKYCLNEEGSGEFYSRFIEDKHGTEKSSVEKKSDIENGKSEAQGAKDHVLLSGSTHLLGWSNIDMKGNILKSERLKYVKSVRSPADSAKTTGSLGSNHNLEVKDISVVGDAQNSGGNIRISDRKDAMVYPKEVRMTILDSKVEHLENRIKILEGELREVAAIEAALYSVVAEHGSSMSKVHAPARRLSRLYLHACKENHQGRRAGAAKNAVSGLVLVAKACGNDVPRLTFWLSNSIVLRTIICQQTTKKMMSSVSSVCSVKKKSEGEGNGKITSPLQWKGSLPWKNENTSAEFRDFGNWDDPHVFILALEKVEAWIFSRIVESIWWQILIPHMQTVDAIITKKDVVSASRKNYRRMSSTCDQEQGSISLDIWKNAFREAWDRLCPIRAGGHECGCLPLLSRLIMEQCVTRLDVAMFNAILRQSADEIPTDPVSDPISDPTVLPIPPGKSSFGAGAQLKTAIGNWSRWLTDLFDMDDDDSFGDKDEPDYNDERQNTSLKSFHLLNALSDLLMLPKDMLLSSSIRKEVCPMFTAPLIKRILDNFEADEFCPDPIPTVVFEALDSENDVEYAKECVRNFPCNAAPIVYLPPPATTIATVIGEVGCESQLRRSRSSVLRKAYTSDDELDELNSPLSSILFDASITPAVSTKPSWKSKNIRNGSAVRYELLRDIWMSSE